MPASPRAQAPIVAALLVCASPALALAYNIYWGDLHGHTMDSPVTLTTTSIDAYILYARDTRNLNFVALTEKDFDLSDSEWSASRSRAAAFTTSSFVAFSAFEWGDGGYGDFGHRPVYYLTDDQPLLRSESAATDHVSELLEALTATNGFTSVAHPDLSNYAMDWDYFDGTVDRVAEIYSRHGHYEDGANGIQAALAQGLRFGIVAVSDSRTGEPGSYGLTAVLSNSFSKSALHAAIKERRTYATTGARIVLQATMDGHAMGEVYTSSTGPTLDVTCTPTASLERIEIIKNNTVVYTYMGTSGAPPNSSSPWKRAPELDTVGWAVEDFDDGAWATTNLVTAVESAGKSSAPVRLRRTLRLDAVPPAAIVRTNLAGDYRIWLNGRLLVDTHGFQYDDPDRPHDCDAPTAHELAGTSEGFRRLGFYDIASLGGELVAGDNVIALEFDGPATQGTSPLLEVTPLVAATPVSFSWADGSYTGDAFYYLRVTQVDGQQAWSSPWWVDRQAPDTTPPQNPVKLRAEKDGSDVYLDWPKVTMDIAGNFEVISFYRIFRGTTPDFVPDRTGFTNQIGTSTRSRYRDSGALTANADYYYKLAAVDAAGNESPGHSNLAFKVRHPVGFHTSVSNIFWLSVPYRSAYSTADQLARDLNRGSSGPCTKVMRWDPGLQRPVSWAFFAGSWTGTNFVLVPGEAVAITIKQDADATLVGAHDEGIAARLVGNPGSPTLNWVSIPIHSPHQLAFQLVQDMNGGYYPTSVTRITRLNPDLQTYQTYQWTGSTWTGTNFVLVPGEAYGVTVQATSDWIPDTAP